MLSRGTESIIIMTNITKSGSKLNSKNKQDWRHFSVFATITVILFHFLRTLATLYRKSQIRIQLNEQKRSEEHTSELQSQR